MINGSADWLAQSVKWISDHGFGSIATALIATGVRYGLRFDTTPREAVLSFVLALFVIALIAPAVAEYLELGPRAAAGAGAGLALIARPLVVGLLTLGQRLKKDPESVIPSKWIGKK